MIKLAEPSAAAPKIELSPAHGKLCACFPGYITLRVIRT